MLLHLRQKLRSHSDWIILLFFVVLVAGGAITILSYFTGEERSPQYEQTASRTYDSESGYPKLIPPNKKFPPPAKEQRNFYVLYDTGNIQYSVTWSNRNVDRNPLIGKHTFTIELYNSRASETTISGKLAKQLTFGCIAADGPYRKLTVKPKAHTLKGFEKDNVVLDIDVSCRYLGTADGEYFWRIY